MQSPILISRSVSPRIIPKFNHPGSGAMDTSETQKGVHRGPSKHTMSGITKTCELVQTIQSGPGSPSDSGHSVVSSNRVYDDKRMQLRSTSSSSVVIPHATNVGTINEEDSTSLETGFVRSRHEGSTGHSEESPKETHRLYLRENTAWAKFNAKYLDTADQHPGPHLPRRRASEDLLWSLPPTQVAVQGHRPQSSDQDVMAVVRGHSLRSLRRSRSTRHWFSRGRGNNACLPLPRKTNDDASLKTHVHKIGHFFEKMAGPSHRTSRESTNGLENSRDDIRRTMTNLDLRAVTRDLRSGHGIARKPNQANVDVIDLNAAESIVEQDMEVERAQSIELSKVFTRHPPDSVRPGSFNSSLPAINIDALMNSSSGLPRTRWEVNSPSLASRSSGEGTVARDETHGRRPRRSVENVTSKNDRPIANKPLLITPQGPPQPGLRTSSKQKRIKSDSEHDLDETCETVASPVTQTQVVGGEMLSDSVYTETTIKALGPTPVNCIATSKNVKWTGCLNTRSLLLPETTYDGTFGPRHGKSSDTLNTINKIEASLSNRPLTPPNSSDSDTVSPKSSGSSKLHVSSVSPGRSSGHAPSWPLPALPGSKTTQKVAKRKLGSRSSSLAKRSSQRTPRQTMHVRKDSGLSRIDSPHRSPRQQTSARRTTTPRSQTIEAISEVADRTKRIDVDSNSEVVTLGLLSSELPPCENNNLRSLQATDITNLALRVKGVRAIKLRDIESNRVSRITQSSNDSQETLCPHPASTPACEDFPSPPSSRPSSIEDIHKTALAAATAINQPQTANQGSTRMRTPPTTPSTARPLSITKAFLATRGSSSPEKHISTSSIATTIHRPHIQPQAPTQSPYPRRMSAESTTLSSDDDGAGALGTSNHHHRQPTRRPTSSASTITTTGLPTELATVHAEIQSMKAVIASNVRAQRRQWQAQQTQIATLQIEKRQLVEVFKKAMRAVSVTSATSSEQKVEGGGGTVVVEPFLTAADAIRGVYERRENNRGSSRRDSLVEESGKVMANTDANEEWGINFDLMQDLVDNSNRKPGKQQQKQQSGVVAAGGEGGAKGYSHHPHLSGECGECC